MEVVQQIGSDSFSPGHGVLIGKSKTGSSTAAPTAASSGTSTPTRRTSTRSTTSRPTARSPRPRSGDERQLNDGSFNVGVNSGGEYEYKTDANGLHFYILDKRTDAHGILRYKVGVRSLEGAGPQTRGVALSNPVTGTAEGFATCTFTLKNTGAAAAIPADRAPDRTPTRTSARDIYRLSATASGTGWTAHLRNALATAKFGESVQVPVYIEKAPAPPPPARSP